MKILIAGDFCANKRIDTAVKNNQFNCLFDEVKPIFESADYSILNLECPLVISPEKAHPIKKNGPCLKGSVEIVDAIKYLGAKCCTLANNHILDQGEQCCLDTEKVLNQAGIDSVGIGHNLNEAKRILYKEIGNGKIAVINCTEHEFAIAKEDSVGACPLSSILQYYQIQEAKKNADTVIVIIHGGHEHYQLPSPRMQEQYRFFIDVGADAVINGHQHCYSGYEIYKQKPIIYGLGNFCFDSITSKGTKWQEGYMAMLDLDGSKIGISKLIPYKQCDEQVGVRLLRDVKAFDNKIKSLNDIISDPTLLKNAAKNFYMETKDYYLSVHQPYGTRFLKKLSRMHLLPSFLYENRILKLINFIECESHRDRELNALYSKLSQ